jgi:tetratricopeptide (TPR) repeat protein
VEAPLNRPAASTSLVDFSTEASLADLSKVTSLMDSPTAASRMRNLIRRHRRGIGVSVIAAIIVLTLAAWAYDSASRKSNAAIDSLAVLPFINVNADQQLDYLSDGMTETLIYSLSQLPNLNVNYAIAHTWYGVMLSCVTRHGEALIESQRALEIDPLSLICNARYGEGLFYARRYDEAVAQLEKTIELDSDFERAPSHPLRRLSSERKLRQSC